MQRSTLNKNRIRGNIQKSPASVLRNDKRKFLITASSVASIELLRANLNTWFPPLINSVVLPAHAQTSGEIDPEPEVSSISCSAQTSAGVLLNGAVAIGPIELTVTTSPPAANGAITIEGICDEVTVSSSPNNPLDENGSFTFTFDESICLPQGSTASFGARVINEATMDVAECTFLTAPPPTIGCRARIPEGGPEVVNGSAASVLDITIFTDPPEPGGLVTIEGLCNGNPVNNSENNVLDQAGELTFTLRPNDIGCATGANNTFGARFTQQSSNSQIECSFVAVQGT